MRAKRLNLNPAQFGTRVHHEVALSVVAEDDENFQPEVSALKTIDETKQKPPKKVDYGTKDSIRVDVLENRNETVCVYDIKTGQSGLLPGRMNEFAMAVGKHYKNAQRIIVMEVRPMQ